MSSNRFYAVLLSSQGADERAWGFLERISSTLKKLNYTICTCLLSYKFEWSDIRNKVLLQALLDYNATNQGENRAINLSGRNVWANVFLLWLFGAIAIKSWDQHNKCKGRLAKVDLEDWIDKEKSNSPLNEESGRGNSIFFAAVRKVENLQKVLKDWGLS